MRSARHTPRPRPTIRAPRWLAGIVAGVLAVALLPAVAVAASDDDGFSRVDIEKYIGDASEGTRTFAPGAQFSYTITVACSGQRGFCLNAGVVDPVPAPLILQSVSAGTPGISRNDSDIAAGLVDIAFTQVEDGTGAVGLSEGGSVNINVNVQIPADITWQQAQDLGDLVNTATITADGTDRELSASDGSTIRIVVPEQLSVDATKSADDNMGGTGRPIPAVPGKPVDFTIGAGNTSNRPVDSLTLVDPATGSANMQYLQTQTLGPIAPPAGADQVAVGYVDTDGVTQTVGTFPAPAASIPLAGIDTSTVAQWVFTFTASSPGVQLPPANGPGDYASIGLGTVTTDAVDTLPESTPTTVTNVVEATVAVDGRTATDTASGAVVIENVPPSVGVTKSFDRNRLLPNESTTVRLRADNGGKDVVELTIADPAPGEPDFAAQGLVFGGFASGIEWPEAATSVIVSYTLADGTIEEVTSTDFDSLPAATDPDEVVGFTISFAGDIVAGAYASTPFAVTGIPVAGDAPVASTNTTLATVTDADSAVRDDTARAVVTRVPLRVYTTVTKNITRDDLYSRPGASTSVSLTGRVNDETDPAGASSIGAEYLIVQDPADPSSTSDFWNHFDVTAIGPIDVPGNAILTIEYYDADADEWTSFATSAAGTTYTAAFPANLRDDAAGIRFVFEPAEAGELLQPGFNVSTPFRATLRETLRDDPGSPAAGNDVTGPIGNVASSIVENPDTGQGAVTGIDDDAVILLPTGPGGPDMVEKSWTHPPADNVGALSAEDTTATISWGTFGLPVERMVITDPTDADTISLDQSVYDAFDLTAIGRISSANDPAIRFDAVYVERLTGAGVWTGLGDGFTAANPSRGGYPGYTLTAAERDDTVGIRFVYTERADRASVITNPTLDPPVGSGVAPTDGLDRDIPLTFTLRDYRRSAPANPVLGDSHVYTYNSGLPGVVLNTVHSRGTAPGGEVYDSFDSDDMLIVDRPLVVSLTKRLVDYDENDPSASVDVDVVGIPQAGTPPEDYPLVTALLTATNQSNTRVSTLTVTDPEPATTGDFLNEFDVHRIADVTVPEGADADLTIVRLSPAIGGVTDFTIAEALALTPAELADVVSVRVLHTGTPNADGGFDTMIEPGASTSLRIEYQLRELPRSGAPRAAGDPHDNNAIATVARPDLDAANQPADLIENARASDSVTLAEGTYGVTADKSISPPSRDETQSPDGYFVTLEGRPTGTVRSVGLTLTDDDPRFWNVFEFSRFSAIVLSRPIDRVRFSVLTGVEYALDGTGALVQTCDGDADLTDCWQVGGWMSPSLGVIVPAGVLDGELSALGVAPADVQGIRYDYGRTDGAQWERPSNPIARGAFFADRRENLVFDGTDDGESTPVPSTQPGLDPAPGETLAGHFTDSVVADADGAWDETPGNPWTATASDSAETVLTHLTGGISVSKTHGREAAASARDAFVPGAEIPYSIAVRNTGEWPITGLTLVDQVEVDGQGPLLAEPFRDIDDTTPIYSAVLNGAPLAGFSASMDAGGRISFTLPPGFVLQPNAALVITARLVFRQQPAPVTPGTIVDNAVTATSDRVFDTCDYTVQGLAQPQTQDAPSCASNTTATPLAQAPVSTSKSVKGVGAGDPDAAPGDANYNDLGTIGIGLPAGSTYCATANAGDGYFRTPCVPITRPGGTSQWRIEFSNNGNIPMTKVVSIDVLPAVGDTGVILSGGRQSRFQPVFTGGLAADLGADRSLTIYYSTVVPNRACNEAEIQSLTGGTTNTACAADLAQRPAMWQVYSESLPDATKAQIRALKFEADFAASPLQPNEKAEVTFQTRTPWYADRPGTAASDGGIDPVAWNSFATGAQGRNGAANVQSAVLEPRKVGVALAAGELRLSKAVSGADPAWGITFPTSYAFDVVCTSGGQNVPLVGTNGASLSRVRLAANGTVLGYNNGTGTWGRVNVPLYAECRIAEAVSDPSSQGTVVTYDPVGPDATTSGTVEALRLSYAANIANPAPVGAPGDVAISALNTYLPGGFSVSKAVENGGAVDQDGTPISYAQRDFGFRAVCTFLDQTALDQTFTVRQGESRVFADLPAGAQCAVTETSTQSAASTSVVVTEDSVAGSAQAGTQASFELLPYPDGSTDARTSAAFTNRYTAGAVRVTKAISGASQWATGNFVLSMTCTLAGVTPSPVWTGTKTMTSPGDLVWTVQNLPTGASCRVTETDRGGANSTNAPITIVVGASNTTPATGTVTNTFTTGSLRVTKALSGAPANGLAPATTDAYAVELSCTRVVNGATVAVAIPGGASRTITGAGTALYSGLPTGAQCTIAETDAGHATSHSFSPAGPYTIGSGATPLAVTLTNVFANGQLQVVKSVDAPEEFPVPDTFTATVSCTWFGAAVPLPSGGVVTVAEGAPATVTGIPLGSVCSVAEADAGQVDTTYDPTSVTVASTTQTVTLGIQNTYEWAALRIGKTVISNAGEVPTGFGFRTVCTFQGETVLDSSITLDSGQFRTYENLPARARCTVVETDDRAADDTTVSAHVDGAAGATAPQIDQEARAVVFPELAPGSAADAANTASYTNLYGTSALVVTKQFAGAGAAQFGEDKTFTVDVVCTYAGETLVDTQLALAAADGWTATITDVVAGAECTVAEPDLQGADAVVITPNDGTQTTTGRVTIPAEGDAVTVEVTNWYLTGSLEVTKTFAGDGADKFGTAAYEFTLACVRDGLDVDIPDGTVRTVDRDAPLARYENLPTGAECTLTETSTGGATSTAILDAGGNPVSDDATAGYTFTVVTDPTILSVDDQAQPALSVENTFDLAEVSATKTVQSEAVDADGEPIVFGPFEVELVCLWNGGAVTAAEDMAREISDGETVTWTELPQGAECTVTETDPADASSTSTVTSVGDEAGDPVDGTIAEIGPLPGLPTGETTTVAFTNVFAAASLTIGKVLAGTAAGYVTQTFPVDVVCTLVDTSHPAPGLVVRDASYEIGGPQALTATIDRMPVGATCVVTETDTGGATSTTATVAGETTTGAAVTVVIGAAASVVFTNTFDAGLSATGGVFGWLLPVLAVALLAAGAVLLLVRRRRRG